MYATTRPMAKTSPAMTPPPRWAESGGGDPAPFADNPRPPEGGEGEPEEVEGEIEAAGGRGKDPKTEGVE